MTAPATTARGTPAHSFLEDGFSTTVAFALIPTASLFEKTVDPPGIDGGEAVPISTMLNTTWRTFTSRELKSMTPMRIVAAYSSKCYSELVSIINVEGSITIHFPDGSKVDFYGYLQSFEPQTVAEGVQPEAVCIITPTNRDPVAKVEQGPVWTVGSGT